MINKIILASKSKLEKEILEKNGIDCVVIHQILTKILLKKA